MMFSKGIHVVFGAATLSLLASASLASGTCKSAYIKAENKTGKQIKVIDMNYEITGYRTKSEPVTNTDIPRDQYFTLTRNLERANGRDTQIVLIYRERKNTKGFDQWTGIKRAYSDFLQCSDGAVFDMVIN